jgi:hypothetical protein
MLSPFLQEYGYLQTEYVLGDGLSCKPLKESITYFEEHWKEEEEMIPC